MSRPVFRRRLAGVLAALGAGSALLGLPAGASANIHPPQVLDGPSAAILDVDGSAMAPDGTGGIVYRRIVDGIPRVFVARITDGVWRPPVQVDHGPFAASQPTIAAGDDGRLMVVWVTPFETTGTDPQNPTTHYQLMFATVGPGASEFGAEHEIDPNDVGDGSAAMPSLAMTPTGTAYVAYRVVTQSYAVGIPAQGTLLPMRPGDEEMDVRVARWAGDQRWTSLGNINRTPGQVTMRRPTADNRPVVAVDQAGDAVVAWQEPTIDAVARIWVRRLFGNARGNVLEASPETYDGTAVEADADQPTIAISNVGEVRVGFRIAGGTGSPTGGQPSIFQNHLPDEFNDDAGRFDGASEVAAGGSISGPAVSLDENSAYRVSFTSGSGVSLFTDPGTGTPISRALGSVVPGTSTVTGVGPAGDDGVSAWLDHDAVGRQVVDVHEDFPGGASQQGSMAAPVSGEVSGLVAGASGLGDALVGFMDSGNDQPQVVGSLVQAPPGAFNVVTPQDWVRAPRALLTWDPAPDALGHVRYSVIVDGQTRASGLGGHRTKLPLTGIGDGVHEAQVMAVDTAGQQTLSAFAELDVDRNAPKVAVAPIKNARVARSESVRVRGRRTRRTVKVLQRHRLQVTLTDAGSGVAAGRTRIDFGDGTHTSGHKTATHAYKRAGRYVVTVRSQDKTGNHGTWRERVQVR